MFNIVLQIKMNVNIASFSYITLGKIDIKNIIHIKWNIYIKNSFKKNIYQYT